MMKKEGKSLFWLGLALGIMLMGSFLTGAWIDRISGLGFLDAVIGERVLQSRRIGEGEVVKTREVVREESTVIKVVEETTVGVVTVSISKTQVLADPLLMFDDFWSQFFGTPKGQPGLKEEKIEQDIGTGFVIDADGLIVTNKHVVGDREAQYRVVVGKDEVVEVEDIYRDPVTDLAILKVDRSGLTALTLGDSDKLKVGQGVIAIGTALGEFRSTVTTGVISGLGRGITAGSPFEGSEKLDNVIQTDAAINPGNSGGPLLDFFGEVIGVNVAVSASGQNIGFALPINLVKESIDNFKSTGEFDRPYLGVAYRMISKQSAILNEVPQGAWVEAVMEGSPADKAGVEEGDIIMEIDGVKLSEEKETSLATIINKHKMGDEVALRVWKGEDEKVFRVKLEKRAE